MQASSIWAGQEYAYSSSYHGKGGWPRNANRVRAIKVSKTKDRYAERATSYVECSILDRETGEVTSSYNRNIRVRDIIAFWDEYREWEQALIDEELREERERKARTAAKSEKAVKVKAAIVELGCPEDAVTVEFNSWSTSDDIGPIKIKVTEEVLSWLGLFDPSTDEGIEQVFGSTWETFDL